MNPVPVVRRVRPSEWRELRALRLQALADAPMAFGSTLTDEQARPDSDWQERASTGAEGVSRVTFIAERGRQWLGLVTGQLADGEASALAERPAWVFGMWVHPEGRQHGLARALIGAVAAWARDRGASALQLHVAQTNAPAIALYERLGFRATGETEPLTHTPSIMENHMLCRLVDFRA